MLGKIRSTYIFKKIIKSIPERVYLNLIIHNKKLQKKLDISIDIYIRYFNLIEIEIIIDNKEIISKKNKFIHKTYENGEPIYHIYENNKFININDEKDKPFYHIYLNDFKNEIDSNYVIKDENDTKIKILIDMEVKSLAKLFKRCFYVKEIKFIKFN